MRRLKALPGSILIVRLVFLAAYFCVTATSYRAQAQASNLIEVNASAQFVPPAPTSFRGGSSIAPDGQTIGLNSRYLMRNGKPWLPVMGEFHFSRVPEREWEDEILKMKAGGVQIVAAYIIWLHHEEIEGQFDWSGQRDLRHFVELCGKNGMYVYPRIGPWAHGEARNGGLPDWVLKKGPTRKNDPVYMSYVARYYAQLGQQLKGLLWKDGGPIIGIQLENEYSMRGPGAGEEHILALKKLANQNGLDVPLYSVTGWGNAVVPKGAVMPVFGGYPDAPWDSSLTNLPASEVYEFRFDSRAAGNMGIVGGKASTNDPTSTVPDTPFMTAEMGGGIQDTYHRRPVIQPDDVAAMFPVMVGSGVNLYGSYMFQGGENPEGKLTTLQESQATGYPTDVPVKSYDFQAPLSEFGTEREVFRKLKLFNYFLNDFGAELAPMVTHAPALTPKSPEDFTVPRLAVRSNQDSGYIFFNNYVRGHSMPARRATQVVIQLPTTRLTIPQRPVDIPSGAYFIWPVNLDIGGVKLRYSTAQLFTKITNGSQSIFVFFAIPGVRSDFAFGDAPGIAVVAKKASPVRRHGTIYVNDMHPGIDARILLKSSTGAETTLVLLTQEEAEQAWKVDIEGSHHLLLTQQQFFADPQHIFLQSDGNPQFRFEVMPVLDHTLSADHALKASASAMGVNVFTATLPERHFLPHYEKIQDAGLAPATKLGPPLAWRSKGVAMAPEDDAFKNAARWRIKVPTDALKGLSNLFLDVQYAGDVARLSVKNHLLVDNFYNGMPWSVGLKRFRTELENGPLELSILPLREDSPIFLEDRFRPTPSANGQIDEVKSIRLIPQYQLVVNSNRR